MSSVEIWGSWRCGRGPKRGRAGGRDPERVMSSPAPRREVYIQPAAQIPSNLVHRALAEHVMRSEPTCKKASSVAKELAYPSVERRTSAGSSGSCRRTAIRTWRHASGMAIEVI